jgi:hypothetical protein
MTGGGRYEREAGELQRLLNAKGVILIVLRGCKGDGFEVRIPPDVAGFVPKVLREMADKIDADIIQLTTGKRG